MTEWSWQKVKQTGMKPTDRISFSMVTLHDDSALLFGGVYDNPNDEHDEDEADSVFFNDIYKLDLTTYKWTCLALRFILVFFSIKHFYVNLKKIS